MTYLEARAISEASADAAQREYAAGRIGSGAAHAEMADEFARAAEIIRLRTA